MEFKEDKGGRVLGVTIYAGLPRTEGFLECKTFSLKMETDPRKPRELSTLILFNHLHSMASNFSPLF